jgi:hypothetical protein
MEFKDISPVVAEDCGALEASREAVNAQQTERNGCVWTRKSLYVVIETVEGIR